MGDTPSPWPDLQTLASLRVKGLVPENVVDVAKAIVRWTESGP